MKNGIYFMTFAIIIGIISLKAIPAPIVTDGLVSYWTFDKAYIVNDTVKDVWSDNNGTIIGNPKVVPGQIGEALKFDGAGDFVNLTTLGDFGRQIGTSSFEAWIKTRNKTDWMTLINTHGEECPNWGIELNGINRRNRLEIIEGTLQFVVSLKEEKENGACVILGTGRSFQIFDGDWHHIVYINEYNLDEGKGKESIYIDSVFYHLGNSLFEGNGAFLPFTDPVYLGARNFRRKSEGYFEGMIDEVRFYDRPLTTDEVIQNFESTQPYNIAPKGKLSTVWATLKTKL